MGQHQQNQVAPLAHQITEVSITFKNGAQLQTYTTHTKDQIKETIRKAKLTNGLIELNTGSDSAKYCNSDLLVPIDEIIIFGVSDVKQPSNIIQMDKRLHKV